MPRSFSLEGIVPLVPLPVADATREIHYSELPALLEFALGMGVAGLQVPGHLNEFLKLSDADRSKIIRAAVEIVDGRSPVIAPVYHYSPDLAAAAAQQYADLGADVIAFTIPRPALVSNDDVLAYCRTVCRAVNVPVLIQDRNPTGPTVGPDFCQRMLETCPNFRYLKLEEPLMYQVAGKLVALRAATNNAIQIFEGWHGLYTLDLLPYGISGVMPNLGVADILARVWALARGDESEQAADIFERVLPQMLFGLQNAEMYVYLDKRLLVERGILSEAAMQPISFSPPAELVARGDFLNRRVARILEQE